MTDASKVYFKVLYDKEGNVVGVEPPEGKTMKCECKPLPENPLNNVAGTTNTEVILMKPSSSGDAKDPAAVTHCIHFACQLWCW